MPDKSDHPKGIAATSITYLPVCAIAVLGAIVIGLGVFTLNYLVQQQEKRLHVHVCRQADALAQAMNPTRIRMLSFNQEDLNNPAFERIQTQLTAYARHMGYRGIRTLRFHEGQWISGPESYTPGDAMSRYPGTVAPDFFMGPDLLIRRSFVMLPAEPVDADSVVTAYAPIIDPSAGNVLMLVGLEIELDAWRQHLEVLRVIPQLWWALALLTLLALGLGLLFIRTELPMVWQQRLRHLEAVLIGVFGVILTGTLSLLSADIETRSQEELFLQESVSDAKLIQDKIYGVRKNLAMVERLFAASDFVDEDEYHLFTHPMTLDIEGYILAWAPRVLEEERDDATTLSPKYGCISGIWKYSAEGDVSPVPIPDVYYPLCYIEPLKYAGDFMGLDLMTLSETRLLADKIAESGLPECLLPMGLLSSDGTDHEMLVMMPVFDEDMEYPKPLHGLLVALVNLRQLLERVTGTQEGAVFPTTVFEVMLISADAETQTIASSSGRTVQSVAFVQRGRLWEKRPFRAVTPVLAFGKVMAIHTRPSPEFLTGKGLWTSKIVALLGLLLSAAFSAFIGFLRAFNRRLESLVWLRTTEAREREEYLAVTMNAMGDGVLVVSPQSMVIRMNPAAERLTGWSADEAKARNVDEVFQIINTQTRVPVETPIRQVLETGAIIGLANHTSLIARDGREFQVADSAAPIRDRAGTIIGVVLVFSDVSREYAAREALRKSEARNRAILHAFPDMIFEYNREGVYLGCHAPVPDLLFVSEEEFMNKSVKEVLPPEVADLTMARLEALFASGNTQVYEYALQVPGGMRTFDCRLVQIDDDRALAIIRDITEARRIQEEQRQLEQKMQQTQKLESLGVLAGGIAHDFNNILMVVMGNGELALEGLPQDSPAREYIGEIQIAARRAAELCRQMLAYSGKATFALEPVCMETLVNEMMHLLKTLVAKKTLMRLYVSKDTPSVLADPGQLQQVIMNLMLNASEALGEEEGIVAITIDVRAWDVINFKEFLQAPDQPDRGDYVAIEISDTGCGMDDETQRRIFEPFFSTKFTGRGLGMAAVLGIVRAHRGAIGIDSKPGQGSTITILLPALAGEACVLPSGQIEEDTSWQGKGLVLLVDDETSLRSVGTRLLKRLGFNVITAEDGLDALRIYREKGAEIDLVMLDLTMPRMNGEETFEELRRINPDVRVILASGYSEEDITPRFAGKGLAAFIQKPYTLGKLREKLTAIL